jgi:uncharacterized membrane protein
VKFLIMSAVIPAKLIILLVFFFLLFLIPLLESFVFFEAFSIHLEPLFISHITKLVDSKLIRRMTVRLNLIIVVLKYFVLAQNQMLRCILFLVLSDERDESLFNLLSSSRVTGKEDGLVLWEFLKNTH